MVSPKWVWYIDIYEGWSYFYLHKIVSEYDQEIPQSQTAGGGGGGA